MITGLTMERAEDVQLGKVHLGVSQGTEFRCIDFVVDYPNFGAFILLSIIRI